MCLMCVVHETHTPNRKWEILVNQPMTVSLGSKRLKLSVWNVNRYRRRGCEIDAMNQEEVWVEYLQNVLESPHMMLCVALTHEPNTKNTRLVH